MSPRCSDSRGTAKPPGGDYKVGYGRPPVATRFLTGGVGNPKGRPKKIKTVGQNIQEAMMTPVTIEENGRFLRVLPTCLESFGEEFPSIALSDS